METAVLLARHLMLHHARKSGDNLLNEREVRLTRLTPPQKIQVLEQHSLGHQLL